MRSLLPLGIDATGLSWTPAWRPTCSMRRPGEYELAQLREQTGQLTLDIAEPGSRRARCWPREAAARGGRRRRAWPPGFRQRLDVRGHGHAARPDRDAPGAGPGQNGGGRHRRRPGRAAGDRRRARRPRRPRSRPRCRSCAGHEFNVNSTPQLRTVLYDELGLTPGKKTKTGFSTDAQTLESLRGDHPIIEALLSLPRGREAALDLRREPAGRGRRPTADPRLVRPDGGPDRPDLLGPAEPAQHPGAHRAREAVPPGLRAGRGLHLPGGRLRPGRAALHRPPLRGPRAHRRVHQRVRRAPHRRRRGLRHRARAR